MSAKHDVELDRLAALLRTGTFTAKQISAKTECAMPTAYERVRALIARGEGVIAIKVTKSNRRGPKATEYGIRE